MYPSITTMSRPAMYWSCSSAIRSPSSREIACCELASGSSTMRKVEASVLITSGILMLADAGLTLAWQEPISAFIAAQEQAQLSKELNAYAKGALRREEALVAAIRNLRRRLAKLGAIERARAKIGGPIGRIELPTLGRHYVVVQGTDIGTLRKGPGHYPSTVFPGEKGTVAIAGHRTTYLAPFRTIDQLKPGQRIILK